MILVLIDIFGHAKREVCTWVGWDFFEGDSFLKSIFVPYFAKIVNAYTSKAFLAIPRNDCLVTSTESPIPA